MDSAIFRFLSAPEVTTSFLYQIFPRAWISHTAFFSWEPCSLLHLASWHLSDARVSKEEGWTISLETCPTWNLPTELHHTLTPSRVVLDGTEEQEKLSVSGIQALRRKCTNMHESGLGRPHRAENLERILDFCENAFSAKGE